jgi:hypothetical protein
LRDDALLEIPAIPPLMDQETRHGE